MERHSRRGQVDIASVWESEGLGFEPRQLQATFDPGLQKEITSDPSQNSVPLMIDICKVHLKRF